MRLLWVPLLLAPAGVVFVATRTTIDPIAGAEHLDVVPHFPAAIELPTAAIGITTPSRHITVRVHARRPVAKRHPVVKRPKTRIAPSPRPVYIVPKTVVTHVVARTTAAPHTSHPSYTSKPKPMPKPTPAPTPPPTTTATPQPTPPAQPPEPPAQPTPTPAAPPSPAPAPPAPTTAQSDGDDDDQGEATDGNTRPGNGWGDRNHEHTGPPGQNNHHH